MSGGNNGKVLTVSRKLAKILTVSRKSHHPLRPSCMYVSIGTVIFKHICDTYEPFKQAIP